MSKTPMVRWMALAGLTCCMAAPALAADARGVWLRSDGVARVKVANCGAALCGTIVWLKGSNSDAKVGERVFFDMVPSGPDSWSGSAFNPEDGNTYSGKMVVAGNTLTTTGCALAGLICKSLTWSRFD